MFGSLVCLSPRQRTILALIADGYTDQEIAVLLDISPATVRAHVRRTYLRLGARSRAAAVCSALLHLGLVWR